MGWSMALNAAQIERAEWSGRRGDTWTRRWERTSGSSTLDADTLVIQIRAGATEGAPLVASSGEAGEASGVAAIDTTGTDFSDPDAYVLAWQIVGSDSADIPAGTYVIEAAAERDGEPATLMTHVWTVLPQVAA